MVSFQGPNRTRAGKRIKHVLLLPVCIMLACTIIASVAAVPITNIMTKKQWEHAERMELTPLSKNAEKGTKVFGVYVNEDGTESKVPAVILENHVMMNGPNEITVMWLDGDRMNNRLNIANVYFRSDAVSYSNYVLDGFVLYPPDAPAARGGAGGSGSAAGKGSVKKAKTKTVPQNNMSEEQWKHAEHMAQTPLPDTAGPGTKVIAIYTDENGVETWSPAVILERHAIDDITVMWLDGDRSSNRLTLDDVYVRDETVAYDNFVLDGSTEYPPLASAVDPAAAGGGSAAGGGAAASGSKRSGEKSKASAKKAKTETEPNDAKSQAEIMKLKNERDRNRQHRDELKATAGSLQSIVHTADAERDTAIDERDDAITERDTAMTDRDTAITERDAAITERDASNLRANAAERRVAEVEAQLSALQRGQRNRRRPEAGVHDHGTCSDFQGMDAAGSKPKRN